MVVEIIGIGLFEVPFEDFSKKKKKRNKRYFKF